MVTVDEPETQNNPKPKPNTNKPKPNTTQNNKSNNNINNQNNKSNTNNTTKPKTKTKPKPKPKSKPAPKIDKKKEENKGGPVDEKGNPFPIDNPEGGDPICPGGYKIDYDFDPINDPINPPFRCISAIKDPNDGAAAKLLEMANNPSAGVANAATGEIPAFGGSSSGRHKYQNRTRKIKRSSRRRSRRRRNRY
jgi:hypothetical protein